MAKKDQLDYGEFSLDSDLDWDFDDSPKLQKLKKSKKPIDHFGEGVLDAVRSKFTDPYHIRDMVKKSLPHGLGRAWDEIEKTSDDLGKLYDDATKELRPHIGSLVRKIDAIVPDSATRAKNLSRHLKERFGQTKVDNRHSTSQEDTVNEGVERMLESLETSRQREIQSEQITRARDFVKDKIDDKRFQESHKALRIIANQGIAATEYLKTFDTAYKRKSLELQYRSYAAQSQTLNAFVKYAERADKFQQALLHNTSLPEYAKTSNAQRFKERGKNKIMDTLHSSMFGKTSRIGLAGQRLKNRAVEKISSIKDTISMIDDALEAAIDSHEMEKEFAEMSGKKASGWKTGGTFIGGVGAEFLSDYISDTLKSIIERNKTASKIAARAGRYASNPGAIIEKVKKSNRYKNFGNEGGISGGIKQAMEGAFSLLSGEGINTKLSDTGIGGQDEDQAVTIRRKTRAVTDVIPGYLARILREVTAIRTGDDKTPLLVFDSQSGKFKTESKLSSDLLSSLKKHAADAKTGTKTYAEEFSSLRNTFVGRDAKASKHDGDINKFLAGISRSSSDFDFTAESLRNTKEFKELSPSAQKAIGDILSKRFDSNDEKTEVRRASLAYKAASTREAIGNLKPAIEQAMAEGHTELLEKAGVISRNSDGEWVIDEKRYFKFFDDNITSDEDVKTNIRPFGGMKATADKALGAFKNTKLFNWDYKAGASFKAGPGISNRQGFMGPMAQDVRRNFGEDAAPNGRSLNLANLNGYTMAAVKGLQDKVEQMGSGEGLRYLSEISDGIKELLHKGSDRVTELTGASRDASQSTTDALLAQIRDINLADKSKNVIDEILRRSKSRQSLTSSPIIGSRLKASLDRMRSIGENLKEGIDSILPPSVTSGAQAARQTILQAMGGNGDRGGVLSSLGGLFSSGKKAFKDFRNSKTGKRLSGGAARLFGRGGGLGALGRLGGWAKNSRLGKAYGRDFSRLGEMGKSVLSGASGLLGGLLSLGDSNKPKFPEESGVNTYSAADHSKNLADKIGNQAKSYANVRGAAFGDRDGDGQRDGGAADRMREAQAARMANEERKKASIEASQKGALAKAQRISPADDAINKMIKIATAGLGSIAGMAGSLLGGAMDIFGGGGGRRGKKGIFRKGLGAAGRFGTRLVGLGGRALLGLGGYAAKGLPGGLLASGSLAGKLAGGALSVGSKIGSGLLSAGSLLGRGISGVAGGLSGIGNAIKGAASLVPGSAKVARVALGATRVAQVVGLMSGGAGGMVSSVLGILGAGISAPVAIGAAAVAGVGYGGFKLYKYLTKNNIDEWQRIRILQYGLDGTDATKSFNSKVLALESYMLDGKLAFSSGVPSINPRAVNAEEIAKLFDISDEDTELAEKFSSWYSKRFQPVFLHHVATLYRVDNKASLDKLDSLDATKKLEYLSGAEIDGIWSETTSPFKGLDVLSDNPKPSRDVISAMIQTQGKKLQEDAKNKIKTGDNKPKGENAANANKVITSAIKPASKEEVTTAVEPESKPVNASGVNFTSISQTSKLAKMRNASAVVSAGVSSEEGAEPKSAGSQTVESTTSNGTTALKTAMGNVSDGSNGMQFIKLGKDANIDNLNPALRKNLLGMAQEYGEATGKPIVINEGWRSFDRQAQLFRKYGPGRAARPGSSLHEYGLALDINTPIMDELERLGLLRKYGFTRPIKGETWHTEPAGIQQAIQRAKNDSAFATAAVEASLGRGGGGLGSKPNSSKGGRDPALAKRLYESGTGEMIDLAKQASSQSNGGGNSTKLSPPQINGLPQRTSEEMAKASGPGFSSQGIGQGVQSSGGFSAEASLGDGTGKYDKIKADIAKYSAEAGADPNEMMMMAAMESSLQGSASAGTSSAKGLMQFVGDTWKEQVGKHGAKYNINPNDIKNDRSQTILAAKYLDSYRGKLQNAAGGRKLEFVDKYMGHMFGPGGGAAMLRADQNASALSIITPLIPGAGASNREVFYDGTRERTVGEVRKLLSDRINAKAKAFGIQLNSSQGQAQMEGVVSQEAAPPIMKDGASSPPKGIDLATQLPMINPNAGTPQSVNPRPKALSGYDLPGVTSPMMFTYGMSNPQQPVRVSSPMQDTAPSAAQIQYNRATSITDDLMTRMVASSDTATKHLESINDTLASRMVPLLEKIADNTGNLGTLGTDSSSSKMEGTATPSKSRDSYAKDVQIKRADKSSFDNRRSLTT